MRKIPGRFAVAASLVAAVVMMTAPSSSAATAYPVNWNAVTGHATGVLVNVPPAGANVGRKPSAAHPDPVILIHGVFSNQNTAWQALSPTLANNGYCVYTLAYGQTARRHLRHSAVGSGDRRTVAA